jgi:hypothetical protein
MNASVLDLLHILQLAVNVRLVGALAVSVHCLPLQVLSRERLQSTGITSSPGRSNARCNGSVGVTAPPLSEGSMGAGTGVASPNAEGGRVSRGCI